jgi:hypothetical protein
VNVQPQRTLLAGLAGGVVFSLTIALLFGQLGSFILLDPAVQSPKLIAVWTQIEPSPVLHTQPLIMMAGLVLLAIGRAFLYRWIGAAWPGGIPSRAWRLAIVVWLSPLFFEFWAPFNLFGEPLPLLALELVFWGIAALAEAFTTVTVIELAPRPRLQAAPSSSASL